MQMMIFLLILLNTLSPGNCSNQVSVLKYKGENECSSALVGVPIESTSSRLEEFTYCGKYFFRFLQRSFLIGIEPSLTLRIWDFENKVGELYYHGAYYRFYFQTLTPDSWQYICLAISSSQIKIVWNGKILLSNPQVDLPQKEIKDSKIWLGGAFFSDEQNKRFEGLIANPSFWNDALHDEDLISITNNDNSVISLAKYDLQSIIASTKNSSCIDHLILDENDVLFQNLKPDNVLLIEFRTDLDSAKCLCEGYGGILTIPKNDEDQKTLGVLIKKSEVCDYALLGLKKSNAERNSSILDLKDNIVPNLKWGLNQPNGGKTQQCIGINSQSEIYDLECYMKYCFVCKIPEKRMFILRGPIPANTERKYFVITNNKYTKIRGLTKTECFWNEGKWDFGMNMKLDNSTNNMPPVGLRSWSNGQKFKFTQCRKDEFTCHIYGHCIEMNKRCDGFPDCPIDGSDENNCHIMTLGKGYEKKYPSVKNIPVIIYMKVYDIKEIDELKMSYIVNFRIELKWYDSRINFRNLKPTNYENKLDILEIEKIWTPNLFIMHSFQVYVEAGQKSLLRIHQNGSPKENKLLEIDEDYFYPGNENPISMVNFFTMKLGCKFDLKW